MQIVSANSAACDAGIHEGMRLSDARALFPALLTQTSEPQEHARVLRKLAEWCQRYTPLVGIDGENALWLDITGAAHLQGGEDKLLADLKRRLMKIGFAHELGLASTPGAAWAIARFSHSKSLSARNIASNAISDALRNFPTDALRLDEKTLHLLKRFGLRTVGELQALSRASLKRRFPSSELHEAVLRRMDQAFGKLAEPVTPLHPEPAYFEHLPCADPILATESFHHGLKKLLCSLAKRMERDLKGATHMTFSAWHADGGVSHVSIGTAHPSRDVKHLTRLFRDRIEKINPGFGVDRIGLAINTIETLKASQLNFSSRSSRHTQADGVFQLIDRLSNRLGTLNVRRVCLCESHIPERAQHFIPALAAGSASENCLMSRTFAPLRLLQPPEPIQVKTEACGRKPQQFVWRRMTHRIVRIEGPQRIAPEWWLINETEETTRAVTRDYFRIEDEQGYRFWLFREGTGHAEIQNKKPRWHMHGIF